MAVLAVGYLQVFGAQRGFICIHSDEVREVEEGHCHQEAQEETFALCGGTDLDCDPLLSDIEHHIPVTIEFQTSVANAASISAPDFVPVIVIDSFFHNEWLSFEAHVESTVLAYSRETRPDILHLSATALTAKCMVLLL